MTLHTPLSKTALQQGAQCPRMLYIKYRMPYSADLYGEDEEEQEQFQIGNIVGEAAQEYFENTVVINTDRGFSPVNYERYAEDTQAYMNDPNIECIAEATFYTGEIVVFVDLLHRNPDGGWDIYEVKSTNRIGPVHVRDASWQTYVARELCGADIRNTYLMHPYAGYHRIQNSDESTDITDLFEIVDDFSTFIDRYTHGGTSTEKGSWMEGYTIQESIDAIIDMLEEDMPPAVPEHGEPGKCFCCSAPYTCNYQEKCAELWRDEQLRSQD